MAAGLGLAPGAHAQRANQAAPTSPAGLAASPPGAAAVPAADCDAHPDPYKDYACLDAYLGSNVVVRLYNYYGLELGHGSAPCDPNAPPGRRADWPTTPESTPPMPFTEWPYGGTTALGVNRPNSVDSPLMVAIANTTPSQFLQDAHIQVYGWVDPGLNFSTNTRQPAGNAPIGYAYTPNTIQLDQAVVYIERTPDTVQKDHVDWGFRLSGIYGENYRYTTSYGLVSSQLLKHNNVNGHDFPMVYGEVFFPQVAQGLMIRIGRYISLPDIEAQLAPNNYMYTHSLSYTYDNYTNTGIQGSVALTRNLIFQLGISDGTETPLWHASARATNLVPYNPLYTGATFAKDPGNQPSFTSCIRHSWDDEHNNIQPCVNGINRGNWGYNNLQWYGATFYHKFNDHWHVSLESYYEYQNGVPNANNAQAQAIYQNGGTPFSPQIIRFNSTLAISPVCEVSRGLEGRLVGNENRGVVKIEDGTERLGGTHASRRHHSTSTDHRCQGVAASDAARLLAGIAIPPACDLIETCSSGTTQQVRHDPSRSSPVAQLSRLARALPRHLLAPDTADRRGPDHGRTAGGRAAHRHQLPARPGPCRASRLHRLPPRAQPERLVRPRACPHASARGRGRLCAFWSHRDRR